MQCDNLGRRWGKKLHLRGIEPRTSDLLNLRSTTELQVLKDHCNLWFIIIAKIDLYQQFGRPALHKTERPHTWNNIKLSAAATIH